MKKNYNYGLEILRIILCFEVVLCHFCNEDGISCKIFYPLFEMRNYAAPTFFFLSFYLTGNKFIDMPRDKFLTRLYRILFPMLIWPFIYWIVLNSFAFIFRLDYYISVKMLVLQLLFSHAYVYPLWFLWDMAIVSILFFFSFYIFKDKTVIAKSIIYVVGIVCLFFNATSINYSVFNNMYYEIKYPVGRLAEMLPLASLALFISSEKVQRVINKKISIITIAIVFALVIAFFRDDAVWNRSFGYAGITVVIVASSQVLLAEKIPSKWFGKAGKGVIDIVSKNAMGIYCIHLLIGNIVTYFLEIGEIQSQTEMKCCIIFVISLLICKVLSLSHNGYIKMLVE